MIAVMGLPIKYPEEMRIKIAKAVVEEGRTANQLSKEFPAPLYMIKRWAKLYRYKGADALRICRRTYSREFKLQVIKYMRENHLSIKEASARFGIPQHRALSLWIRQYEEDPQAFSLPKKTKGE
ncbi:MAG TPA: hypothetical protein DCS74_05300 [Veillonellaceae bacterium]|jgi:transposase|nr:hypothetical protein [Veillonellaceae bacterium]